MLHPSAERAIVASVRDGKTAHLSAYDAQIAGALRRECAGSAESGGVIEFWGVIEEFWGVMKEWRVRMPAA